jgi:hypothetical protein
MGEILFLLFASHHFVSRGNISHLSLFLEKVCPGKLIRWHFLDLFSHRSTTALRVLRSRLLLCDPEQYRVSFVLFFKSSRKPHPLQTIRHQKQLENVEYFNRLDSKMTNDARCTRKITSRIAMGKVTFNKNKTLFTNKLDLNLSKKTSQVLHL